MRKRMAVVVLLGVMTTIAVVPIVRRRYSPCPPFVKATGLLRTGRTCRIGRFLDSSLC